MSLFCIKMPGSAQLLELHCCAWISIVWLELNKLSGFAQFGWNKISCLDFHSWAGQFNLCLVWHSLITRLDLAGLTYIAWNTIVY